MAPACVGRIARHGHTHVGRMAGRDLSSFASPAQCQDSCGMALMGCEELAAAHGELGCAAESRIITPHNTVVNDKDEHGGQWVS